MLLLRILRVIVGTLILLVTFTIFEILIPDHAPKDWIDTWPFAATVIVMMEIVAGNGKSRAAAEELLSIYQTKSIAHIAGRETLNAILTLAEGEPRHRNVAIVRRVVDLALRGDAIAMEALSEKVAPAILHRAIRSDVLLDQLRGDRLRLWRLTEQASSGGGTENACKLMAFGLGMRSVLHLSVPLTERERLACSAMWQDFAPQGAL